MFHKVVKQLNSYYISFCKSNQRELTRSVLKKLPRSMSVYAFYRRGKPIYVGRANNLRNRVVNQHLSKSNAVMASSFRSHLRGKRPNDLKAIKQYKEARNWILKNCTIKFVKVADYDYSLLFETLLIKLWRKKYRLLNDKKDPLEV
jgi:hypothetical protein